MRSKLNSKNVNAIIDAYQRGASMRSVAVWAGVRKSSVAHILHKNGIRVRAHGVRYVHAPVESAKAMIAPNRPEDSF